MAIIKRRDLYSPLKDQPEVFSDFNINLEVHPVRKDVMRYTNENAVKRSIKNILFTRYGTRFFQPQLAGDIERLLFEPFTNTTLTTAKDLIKTAIANHEPRAKVLDVTVSASPDENTLFVGIVFSIINKQEPVTLELTIDRIR